MTSSHGTGFRVGDRAHDQSGSSRRTVARGGDRWLRLIRHTHMHSIIRAPSNNETNWAMGFRFGSMPKLTYSTRQDRARAMDTGTII